MALVAARDADRHPYRNAGWPRARLHRVTLSRPLPRDGDADVRLDLRRRLSRDEVSRRRRRHRRHPLPALRRADDFRLSRVLVCVGAGVRDRAAHAQPAPRPFGARVRGDSQRRTCRRSVGRADAALQDSGLRLRRCAGGSERGGLRCVPRHRRSRCGRRHAFDHAAADGGAGRKRRRLGRADRRRADRFSRHQRASVREHARGGVRRARHPRRHRGAGRRVRSDPRPVQAW